MITTEQIVKILPTNKNAAAWLVYINTYTRKYNIVSENEIAMFLAQTAHESNEYNSIAENLNYSAAGLVKTFSKRISKDMAKELQKQPEKIANYVYANRYGNGDVASGDGWRYRGGGLIQLTFKNNYKEFAKECSMSIDKAPDYIRTKEGAVHSACWYWGYHDINKWADAPDCDSVSDIINIGRKTEAIGDAIGYTNRKARFDTILTILAS